MKCVNCGLCGSTEFMYVYNGNSLCSDCYELARSLEILTIAERTEDSKSVIKIMKRRISLLRKEVKLNRESTRVKYPEII